MGGKLSNPKNNKSNPELSPLQINDIKPFSIASLISLYISSIKKPNIVPITSKVGYSKWVTGAWISIWDCVNKNSLMEGEVQFHQMSGCLVVLNFAEPQFKEFQINCPSLRQFWKSTCEMMNHTFCMFYVNRLKEMFLSFSNRRFHSSLFLLKEEPRFTLLNSLQHKY